MIKYDHFTAIVTGESTKRDLPAIQGKVDKMRENGRVKVSYDVEILRSQPSSFTIFRNGGQITLQGQFESEETRKHFGETAAINGGYRR